MPTQAVPETDAVRQLLASPTASHIEESVQRRLSDSSYVRLHDIKCDCMDGTLTLRGRVSSYFLKQAAQESVRGVRGVERIDNQIEVA